MLAHQPVLAAAFLVAARFSADGDPFPLYDHLYILWLDAGHGRPYLERVVAFDQVDGNRIGPKAREALPSSANALLKPAIHGLSDGHHVAEGIPTIDRHLQLPFCGRLAAMWCLVPMTLTPMRFRHVVCHERAGNVRRTTRCTMKLG